MWLLQEADGRCLSAGCRGCKVSLASCSGGAPAGNTQWRVTEAGAVASGAGLCLGANPATTIENLTVVGSAPVEVGRASDSWFFFPDKLAAFPPFWNGSGIFEQSDRATPAAVLIGVTTSSDDFHDQGWTGRHFVSRDDGLTFKEIDNTEHESWRDAHMCLPWNDSATRNPSLLCTPFTSKCRPEDAPCKASSTAYVNGTVYEHDVAAGTSRKYARHLRAGFEVQLHAAEYERPVWEQPSLLRLYVHNQPHVRGAAQRHLQHATPPADQRPRLLFPRRVVIGPDPTPP